MDLPAGKSLDLPAPTRVGWRTLWTWRWAGVGALFAAIFLLRLLDSEWPAFWSVLFVIPVIVAARLSSVRGGFAAGAFALVLVAAWDLIKGVDLGFKGYVSRGCAFLVAGGIAALPNGREPSVHGSTQGSHEMRRRDTLKLARVGTWELDLATNAMTWSDEYHHLYGVDADVFPSSRDAFQEIVHADDRDVLTRAIRLIVDDGVAAEVRYRIVRPSDGAERCIRSHMRCERDASGKPITLLGTGQDITDLVMVLSRREREMLMLLAEGLSGEQIAEKFTLSPATVRTHINNAMTKLGAHTRGQAIAIALRTEEIGS
ncbi:MAG: LuxR C-terminal-related transcriptional regulator [Solirubrobacteraceae bacterium]